MVEAAVEHQLLGDRFAFGQRQAQAQLVIGKTVALDLRRGQATGLGQAQGGGALVIEIQQLALHQNSTNTVGTCSGLPRLTPLARSVAWRAKARSAGKSA